MPIFHAGQDVQIHLRGERFPGTLIYEKARELALRVKDHPVFQNDSIWTLLKNETVHAEYEQAQFRCSFDTRMVDLDRDRTQEGDWILNIQIPARIRRVNRRLA